MSQALRTTEAGSVRNSIAIFSQTDMVNSKGFLLLIIVIALFSTTNIVKVVAEGRISSARVSFTLVIRILNNSARKHDIFLKKIFHIKYNTDL